MSWGSWLSGADASNAPLTSNFHPVTSAQQQDSLFGKLEQKDLEWTCAGGFVTETQTWYSILKDGTFATSQIIHSSVGLWYPQIQITFKLFNPKTKERVWKSVNVTHWVCPHPQTANDKRSIKADQFDIKLTTDPKSGDETYQINANMDTDLQLSWSFTRPSTSSGFKLGSGPQGGMSYFGNKKDSPDGYVVHRFWPQAISKGHIISKGKAIDADGQGMFVHAIQGMRPNLVASKWNFCNFQSESLGGVQGIMMEFTTINDYGLPPSSSSTSTKEGEQLKREVVTVNIGSISIGKKLITVTGSTRAGQSGEGLQGSQSTVKHLNKVLDPDTSYKTPQEIQFDWQGQALGQDGKGQGEDNLVNATLKVDLGKPHPSDQAKGLVEKVDVLAEIPYVIKKFVNYVAGTKPYIYQTVNPATLELTLPESVKVEGAEGSQLKVEGTVYEEHTFISE